MCVVIYLIMGDSVSVVVYVAILISTAVCDVLSYLVKWYLEKEEADKINRRIAERRRKKKMDERELFMIDPYITDVFMDI